MRGIVREYRPCVETMGATHRALLGFVTQSNGKFAVSRFATFAASFDRAPRVECRGEYM